MNLITVVLDVAEDITPALRVAAAAGEAVVLAVGVLALAVVTSLRGSGKQQRSKLEESRELHIQSFDGMLTMMDQGNELLRS